MNKRQVGAAILSNFESAESAIVKMQNSAGNAMQEMEKVYDSLEYKLNTFQETWVGVAQALLNDDLLKFIMDVGNGISSVVASITKGLGLVGTGGLALLTKELFNLATSAGRPNVYGFTMIVPAYTLVVTRNEPAA